MKLMATISTSLLVLLSIVSVSSAVPIIFEVDVSGSYISIDGITNLPPPVGQGKVSIVGNQTKLGDWNPNMIWLKNDGVGPDVSATDTIWTGKFDFLPETHLLYKYTIGIDSDLGIWSGTEEFAVTARGYTVPIDYANTIRIRDIFADRPLNGSLGSSTEITIFPTPVPEPSTVLLFGACLAGLVIWRRKKG